MLRYQYINSCFIYWLTLRVCAYETCLLIRTNSNGPQLFVMNIRFRFRRRSVDLTTAKCQKSMGGRGSTPYPAGEAYTAPPDLLGGGEGLAAPSPRTLPGTPALGPTSYCVPLQFFVASDAPCARTSILAMISQNIL